MTSPCSFVKTLSRAGLSQPELHFCRCAPNRLSNLPRHRDRLLPKRAPRRVSQPSRLKSHNVPACAFGTKCTFDPIISSKLSLTGLQDRGLTSRIGEVRP